MKLGSGQLTSSGFFMVVKMLSHSIPGERLGRLHDVNYKSGNQSSERLSDLSKTTEGGQEVLLYHLAPPSSIPQGLGGEANVF